MEPPESLPTRLYLLAYDLGRTRPGRGNLAIALRAAALEDLRLAGHLTEDGGKVRVVSQRTLSDPVLDTILREVGEGRPRPWKHWVAVRSRPTLRAVRDQLDDRLYVRVEHRRVLGIFPHTTVTARAPRVIEQLKRTVTQTLTRGPAVSHVDAREAALIAFAALVELNSVFPRRLRREHKARIEEFVKHVTPVAPALKKVIEAQAAAAAGG